MRSGFTVFSGATQRPSRRHPRQGGAGVVKQRLSDQKEAELANLLCERIIAADARLPSKEMHPDARGRRAFRRSLWWTMLREVVPNPEDVLVRRRDAALKHRADRRAAVQPRANA
jgi:glycerol-3-phosphate dehydrogenase